MYILNRIDDFFPSRINDFALFVPVNYVQIKIISKKNLVTMSVNLILFPYYITMNIDVTKSGEFFKILKTTIFTIETGSLSHIIRA